MKTFWIVVVGMAALVASAAAATPTPLQLHKITAKRQDDYFKMTIVLNHAWKSGLLAKGTGRSLTILYETTGDSKTDYVGKVTFHDGQLFEHITGRGSQFPEVLVNRPSPTTAVFKHPADVLFADPAVPGLMKLAIIFKRPGYVPDRLPRKGWWPIPRPR